MKYFIKIVLTLLFGIYLTALANQILFKYVSPSEMVSHFKSATWQNYNFIPFKTIVYYLFLADINLNIRYIRVMNLVGNIIGFIPFGIILPLLLKKFMKLKRVLIAVFCLSFTYEITQLLFKIGSFDIDDLILNTLGGVLGYLPIKLVLIFINSKKKYLKEEVLVK